MLRRDFMLKLIEQFAKMVAKLLELDYVEKPQIFKNDFDALIRDYYKINPDELKLLLTEDPDRDALLLDEKSKNSQFSVFSRAGLVFFRNKEEAKALICIKIIERIQKHHNDLFEFPNGESKKIEVEISELKKLVFGN